MDKQLLHELNLYIEKNRKENIIIRESFVYDYDYVMPMKSIRKDVPDKAAAPENEKEDTAWLEKFRRKPSNKTDGKRKSSCLSLSEEALEEYINKEKSRETFSTRLLRHIDNSGLTDAEIYKKAGLDRRHFSKIRCDKYYNPKKATAIALCMALELSLEETEKMLMLAGYSLSNSDIGDLVIKFFIEKKIYDLSAVNEALDYFGQKLLGVVG